jgi:hypothetical protein
MGDRRRARQDVKRASITSPLSTPDREQSRRPRVLVFHGSSTPPRRDLRLAHCRNGRIATADDDHRSTSGPLSQCASWSSPDLTQPRPSRQCRIHGKGTLSADLRRRLRDHAKAKAQPADGYRAVSPSGKPRAASLGPAVSLLDERRRCLQSVRRVAIRSPGLSTHGGRERSR